MSTFLRFAAALRRNDRRRHGGAGAAADAGSRLRLAARCELAAEPFPKPRALAKLERLSCRRECRRRLGRRPGRGFHRCPRQSLRGLRRRRRRDSDRSARNGAGAIGGAQIGYDFEWPFGLLTGVEADFQAFSFSDSAQLSTAALTGSAGAVKGTKRVDNLGTLRLRLGYQVTPGVLFYGTGGYAYGQAGFTASGAAVSFPLNFAAVSLANYAGQRGGFAAGGGLEYAISPNLIGRVEYLRYDLGGARRLTPFLTTDGSLQWPGLAQRVAATFSGNILRVGLNYRFTPELPAPALPVVAKY